MIMNTSENKNVPSDLVLETAVEVVPAELSTDVRGTQTDRPRRARGRGGRPQRNSRSSRSGEGGRDRRPEFQQKVIGMRRVARVMAGGRRFNFSVAMVLGDRKGRVGFGLGKAMDTALAIEKAINDAKKHMITLNLTKTNSIPHDISAKYNASVVAIRPSPGKGLVAGSAVRVVLELAGITDVTAKLHSRSKNPINNARVAMKALAQVAKSNI